MYEYLDREEKEKITPVSKPFFPVTLFRNKYLSSTACPKYLVAVYGGGRGEYCLENDHHISHVS